jgi:hypothetical protein
MRRKRNDEMQHLGKHILKIFMYLCLNIYYKKLYRIEIDYTIL